MQKVKVAAVAFPGVQDIGVTRSAKDLAILQYQMLGLASTASGFCWTLPTPEQIRQARELVDALKFAEAMPHD